MDSFARLVSLMATLRGPDGCPWDRQQTHESLRRYLLEEACEVLEAIDAGESAKLCEELGDLLLQIVFHAQLAAERGEFDAGAVCDQLNAKLVRRHPHVWGDRAALADADLVLGVWEEAKRAERGGVDRESVLDGVPRDLPGLARAMQLQRRAGKVGFDWPNQAGRLEKIAEELAELEAAVAQGDPREVEAEFGDLVFMVVNAGRGLGLDAEEALRRTNAKFERRFRAMERLAGGSAAFAALDLDGQEALWQQVKRTERQAGESDESVADVEDGDAVAVAGVRDEA